MTFDDLQALKPGDMVRHRESGTLWRVHSRISDTSFSVRKSDREHQIGIDAQQIGWHDPDYKGWDRFIPEEEC